VEWFTLRLGYWCHPLVNFGFDHRVSCTYAYNLKHVVGLKDQMNKKAHAESTQLACETAGSIASLTRE